MFTWAPIPKNRTDPMISSNGNDLSYTNTLPGFCIPAWLNCIDCCGIMPICPCIPCMFIMPPICRIWFGLNWPWWLGLLKPGYCPDILLLWSFSSGINTGVLSYTLKHTHTLFGNLSSTGHSQAKLNCSNHLFVVYLFTRRQCQSCRTKLLSAY